MESGDSMKYSLKDMAEYFKPTSYGLANLVQLNDQTFWLTLGSCTTGSINEENKNRKAIITGNYIVNASGRYNVYISLDEDNIKSNVISMAADGTTHEFKFELIIPANSASGNLSFKTVEPSNVGSIYFSNIRLKLLVEEESTWTALETVSGCLTTIADWIRSQKRYGGGS